MTWRTRLLPCRTKLPACWRGILIQMNLRAKCQTWMISKHSLPVSMQLLKRPRPSENRHSAIFIVGLRLILRKAFPCLQPAAAFFRHPFKRGSSYSPPQRPLGCGHSASAAAFFAHRAYASRDRLQGRRPPLPATSSAQLTVATIRVAADRTPSSQLVAASCEAALLPLFAGLALASLSLPLSPIVTLAAGQRVRRDRLCRLGGRHGADLSFAF